MKEYFLYAIGEIALVVIGILVALQINNWNENRKQQNQLKGILKNVSYDLALDTLISTRLIEFYKTRDSASKRIIRQEINRDNYKECRLCPTLVTVYQPMNINLKGYELLKKYSNDNLEQKDSLVTNLVQFYNQFINLFEASNKRLEDNAIKNIEAFQEFSWYVDYSQGKFNEKALSYFVESEDFRKRVVTHNIYSIGNHLRLVEVYKINAIKGLEEIEKRFNGSKREMAIEKKDSLKTSK